MLHLFNINFKIVGMVFLAITIGGLLCGDDVSAACDEENTSCISVSFGDIVGNTNLQASGPNSSTHGVDRAYFYLPVSLSITHADDYNVMVYSMNGGELRSANGAAIPTLAGEAAKGTSLQDLGKDGSVWGYRFNLGDTADDVAKNYLKVPSQNDPEANVVTGGRTSGKDKSASKVLTLGFAAAVDGNLPAGNYSDQIVVAVTATPLQANAFGYIYTMQEMTSEICASATTPSKDATLPDATGVHHGDTRYWPEAILEDTRDGKEYLVRKLADGNCWMSQNLSLMLSTSTTLTNDTTDLNSKTSWTPTHNTQTSTGMSWGQNDGKDHSCSVGWDQYWAGGTTFNTTGAAAQGGAAGYAQRGVYYNWFTATVGSGKTTDTSTTTDGNRIINGAVQDSICPKGWTLPIGGVTAIDSTNGSIKSFYNLVQIYTGKTGSFSGTVNTLYTSPMQFVPAGAYDYNNGALIGVGEKQDYWSKTVNNATLVNHLYFNVNSVLAGTSASSKGIGLSIRCVAR